MSAYRPSFPSDVDTITHRRLFNYVYQDLCSWMSKQTRDCREALDAGCPCSLFSGRASRLDLNLMLPKILVYQHVWIFVSAGNICFSRSCLNTYFFAGGVRLRQHRTASGLTHADSSWKMYESRNPIYGLRGVRPRKRKHGTLFVVTHSWQQYHEVYIDRLERCEVTSLADLCMRVGRAQVVVSVFWRRYLGSFVDSSILTWVYYFYIQKGAMQYILRT